MPAATYFSARSEGNLKHTFTSGEAIKGYVALLPDGLTTAPVPAELTVGSGGVAKGATSLPLSAALPTGVFIAKGQYFNFIDATGNEYLVQVNANADARSASVNTLTIVAASKAIPAAAESCFPCYLMERTAHDISESIAEDTVRTKDTGGAEVSTQGAISRTFSIPGVYYWANDAVRTAFYAARNKKSIWYSQRKPAPTPDFKIGDVVEGVATLTSLGDTNPLEGQSTDDLQGRFQTFTAYDPEPVA
jgi:hypothetical protein